MELAPVRYPTFTLDLSQHLQILERLNKTPSHDNFQVDPHNPLADCLKYIIQQLLEQRQGIIHIGQQYTENLQQVQRFNTELVRQLLNTHENMNRAHNTLFEVNQWQTQAMVELGKQHHHLENLDTKCKFLHDACHDDHSTLTLLQTQMHQALEDIQLLHRHNSSLQARVDAAEGGR